MSEFLLKNRTTNTSGDYGYTQFLNGGIVFAEGTFDGATVGVEVQYKGGATWKKLTDAQFTSDADEPIQIASGDFRIRGFLSDAGGSTSLNLVAVPRT